MKFRAHETFSIRKGWLHKGIQAISTMPRLFVDRGLNSQDVLGMGTNMVKSLRYWLQATGLTVEENGKGMSLSEFGKIVERNDNYFEEVGTWLMIHYFLASNKDMATSWYCLFNEINSSSFNKEDFFEFIKLYVQDSNETKIPSDRVLGDDFECVVKTYYNAKEYSDPESNFTCPLTDLGLINEVSSSSEKIYSKNSAIVSIPAYIALAIIINEADKNKQSKEIRISYIEKDKCNLGKIFNLNHIAISECLDKLQNLGLINVIRTAGLDIVKIKTDLSFFECIQKYYDSID